MQGKQVLITGASSGIGRALAAWMVRRGATVHAAARREEALQKLAAELAGHPGKVVPLRLDVSDTHATVAAIRRLDEQAPLDVVVANAGHGIDTPAKRFDWAVAEGVLQVNVLGAAATLGAALPAMVQRRRGHLVGISSISALMPVERMSAYAASKAFLSHFLECLRMDVEGTGVKVTLVQPGFVKSEMTAKNKFKMPFLLETDDAAARIGKAIERGTKVLTFPAPMAVAARTLALAPPSARTLLTKRRR